MKIYCEQFIPKEDMDLFFRIRKAVEAMTNPDLGHDENGEEIDLSCHMIARAVAKLFSVKFLDGFYIKGFQHSWIETKHGHLIDVYPIGVIGGPILLENTSRFSPARRLYFPEKSWKVTRGTFSTVTFRRSVRRVTKALCIAMDQSSSTQPRTS